MMAVRDWSGSSLGPVDAWSQSLRTAVTTLLASPVPIVMLWGEDGVMLYNDAYSVFAGGRHPELLGSKVREGWAEIADFNDNVMRVGLAGGTLNYRDQELVLHRHGRPEPVFMNLDYSPVFDEAGAPAGVLAIVVETTERVATERRQAFLVTLGDTLRDLTDPVALTEAAARLLGEHLGADRAGYGKISPDGTIVSVAHDWTVGTMVPMAGEARAMDTFGPELVADLRAGRTLVVEDCLSDPRTADAAFLGAWESLGARAAIVAPLIGADRLMAVLYVHTASPRAWSELEVRLVEDVGSRTLAAVERARAEAALRESQAALAAEVAALERLQQVSTRLVGDESPQAIYDAILTAAAELMGSESASIQMLDRAGQLQLLAHRGYDPRSAAYWQTVDAASDSSCGLALTRGERVIVHDVERSGLAGDSGDLRSYRWSGMRAVQTTPLLSRSGRPLGMLSTHWQHPHTPSTRDLKLFDVLARQAADAIERAMAQAGLRESEARQAFLLSLSDTLRLLDTPLAIASVAAERLGERFGLSRVFYAEFFGSVMKIERDYTRGVESIVGEHDLAAFGPQLLDAYHKAPIVKVDDVRTDPRFGPDARAGLADRQVGAYLDVVLFENERWVSVLALQSATPRRWTASEEGLFREVGERVKAAIERLRAEDRMRELNETLERRVADALAERNMLAKLVETTDVMIMAVDLDYNILAVNAANADEFERIYGVRPATGDNMLALLDHQPTHREQVRAGWAQGLHGEPFTFTEDYGDPDRDRPYYEVTFRPLRDDSGAQVGVYQFATDVTDRLRREAQLAEAQEALRQSQKMEAMGQLTGGVAHDFNNLLTPIVGSLDMLQRKQLGGEREQRLVAGAMQSAERAKTLVQRLLAFARRQPLQPVPVDIARLVTGMGDLVASTTGPQIRVLVEAPDDLPPAMADPNQLEMALLNLAVNARDAMADGGGTLRISITAEEVEAGHRAPLRPGTYLCLSVADTGTGMDEATIARSVEPFFSTKGVGKGTGLGLSMVHGLASQLGGALTIRSRIGLGTNVELWLPLSATAPEAARPLVETPDPSETRGTALLVDDEEVVRMSTADMLADLGYRVVEADSAEQALGLVGAGGQFDLLVTDHLMPGLSGTDLARRVRAARPDLPVLIVSGYAQLEGVDPDLPRLTKPFRKDELAASLARLATAA